MRLFTITLILFSLTFAGCTDSDEPLQGWKESEVEIVNEGTAPGSSSPIVVPGDPTTAPMTGTNFDTSTDLDMITDEQLGLESDDETRDGAGRLEGSVAGQIHPATGDTRERTPARTMTEPRPEPEPTRSAPASATSTTRRRTPSPRPAEPEPAPPASDVDESESETTAAEEEPEEEENIQQEESLPPIIIPAPDPPNRAEPEQGGTATNAADR